MWLALSILGVLFMIVMMAVFFNPPEAWVKKAFLRESKAKNPPAKPE